MFTTVKQLQIYSLLSFQNYIPWLKTEGSTDYGKLECFIIKHKKYVKLMSIVPEKHQIFIVTWMTIQWKEWEEDLDKHFSKNTLRFTQILLENMLGHMRF